MEQTTKQSIQTRSPKTLLDRIVRRERTQQSGTIHRLFSEQAAKHPNKTAVIDNTGIALSYQALNKKANQFEHYLISQVIKQESVVGICMPRTVNMIVALDETR